MAQEIYLLTKEVSSGTTTKGGVDTIAVVAGSEADAKAMAEAQFTGDSNAAWSAITPVKASAITVMPDWTLRVVITDPATMIVAHDVSVVGTGANVMNDLGDKMAAALVVDGLTAAYATPTLTVAAIADGIGDNRLEVFAYPPASTTVPVTSRVGAITDEGIAGAVLTVALVVTATVPAVLGQFKSC